MNPNKKCQVIQGDLTMCPNIGTKITVRMDVKGKEEVHDLWMCQLHINMQKNREGKLLQN